MSQAIISRRGGGGYATVKFDGYKTHSGLEHSTAATGLSLARHRISAVSVGDYALFGGGDTNGSDYKTTVDVYTSKLVKGTASSLSAARIYMATTTVGNYALFGGGHAGSSNSATAYFNTVDAYNTNLTRSTPTTLSNKPNYLAATTVGNYALFGGGETYTDPSVSGFYYYLTTVDTYTSNLVKGTATSLSVGRSHLAATTVGNYAIFAGGGKYEYTGSYASAGGYYKDFNTVDTYTDNLVKGTATSLSEEKRDLSATTVGDYALFAGGYKLLSSGSESYSTVDAYNSSLTRYSPVGLSSARSSFPATTVGDYALFGNTTSFPTIDTYTSSLVKGVAPELSETRGNTGVTTVGNYALFAGGVIYGGTFSTTVDVYCALSTFDIMVCKNAKYKFQNMEEEVTVTENVKNITVPMPATGYIKFKNTTIS